MSCIFLRTSRTTGSWEYRSNKIDGMHTKRAAALIAGIVGAIFIVLGAMYTFGPVGSYGFVTSIVIAGIQL